MTKCHCPICAAKQEFGLPKTQNARQRFGQVSDAPFQSFDENRKANRLHFLGRGFVRFHQSEYGIRRVPLRRRVEQGGNKDSVGVHG